MEYMWLTYKATTTHSYKDDSISIYSGIDGYAGVCTRVSRIPTLQFEHPAVPGLTHCCVTGRRQWPAVSWIVARLRAVRTNVWRAANSDFGHWA